MNNADKVKQLEETIQEIALSHENQFKFINFTGEMKDKEIEELKMYI
jgi:hypothetical protein